MNHIYTTPPKTGFLISKINDLPKSGHATLREFSSHIQTCQIMTCNMLAKNENISSPNSAKMLSFVIILLSSRGSVTQHARCHDIGYRAINRVLKVARKIRRKCYHFVIIVIDNKKNDDHACWCLFLSFFSVQKMTFVHSLFIVTIMLS